jgi:peptidyl-prolyl cis-trans isomerase C
MVQELLKERNKSVVTDAKVKAKYDELAKQMSGKEEVHASHILVEKEDLAKELYKKVKDGADFAKLAKEKSADRGSAVKGGDLGYFTKDQMVPEFAEAAFDLKKGEISEPVKSAFGWHIIKLQDRRKLPVPTLEESRPQIEQQLAAEANQEFIFGLLKESKVKYYNPEGKEIPFPAEQKVDAPKQ